MREGGRREAGGNVDCGPSPVWPRLSFSPILGEVTTAACAWTPSSLLPDCGRVPRRGYMAVGPDQIHIK